MYSDNGKGLSSWSNYGIVFFLFVSFLFFDFIPSEVISNIETCGLFSSVLLFRVFLLREALFVTFLLEKHGALAPSETPLVCLTLDVGADEISSLFVRIV